MSLVWKTHPTNMIFNVFIVLQTSLLLINSHNKNQDSQFLISNVFFVSKDNLFDVFLHSGRYKETVRSQLMLTVSTLS